MSVNNFSKWIRTVYKQNCKDTFVLNNYFIFKTVLKNFIFIIYWKFITGV
jgi:hypothetical protein